MAARTDEVHIGVGELEERVAGEELGQEGQGELGEARLEQPSELHRDLVPHLLHPMHA
jgi:hypothetical protein